jgi:F-type H+-transporting ATPase subunit delta
VAKRYARALLALADRGNEEKWGVELERLAAIVDSPELIDRLSSPELSLQMRQEAMAKIAERLELSFPVRSFAVVVARHGRIREVRAIAESYRDLVDAMLGRERAKLIFAIEPSDEELGRVVSGLEAIARKKIIPTVTVDPSLIGGVVAEMGGRTYDGSLANLLEEAKRRLAG